MRAAAHKIIHVCLVLTLLCSLAKGQTAQEPQRGPSTPEERQRFLTLVHKLEQTPLDKSLQTEKRWALIWLVQVPDIHVKMCIDA
ncbi:MAG TPA: hypothetical protein VI685_07175, partial [Candidatus Angelobacter sp.]